MYYPMIFGETIKAVMFWDNILGYVAVILAFLSSSLR